MKTHYFLILIIFVFTINCSPKKDINTAPFTAWEHIDYTGSNLELHETTEWIGSEWNDKISSLKVAEGYTVNLYPDANFKGEKVSLKGPIEYICTEKTNDNISSVEILK